MCIRVKLLPLQGQHIPFCAFFKTFDASNLSSLCVFCIHICSLWLLFHLLFQDHHSRAEETPTQAPSRAALLRLVPRPLPSCRTNDFQPCLSPLHLGVLALLIKLLLHTNRVSITIKLRVRFPNPTGKTQLNYSVSSNVLNYSLLSNCFECRASNSNFVSVLTTGLPIRWSVWWE